MIGNDLIEFGACRIYKPDRWRAYWTKVLSPEEWGDFAFEANDPAAWLYWAAKESAWKVWFRRSAKRLLNPKAFRLSAIEWEGSEAGFQVQGPTQTYRGRASMDAKHLHAWVWREAFGEADSNREPPQKLKIASCERSQLNQSALDSLPDNILADQVLRDQKGIPHFAKDGNPLNIPLSLSHHGSRAAFAYVYP